MPTYCIDTSSLITAWHVWYPIASFPTFWTNLENLFDNGRLISPLPVYEELAAKKDALFTWFKGKKGSFVPYEEDGLIDGMRAIVERYDNLLYNPATGKSGGDPFVVALAQMRGAIVVTSERHSHNRAEQVRIPDACHDYGLDFMDINGIIKTEGWVFR